MFVRSIWLVIPGALSLSHGAVGQATPTPEPSAEPAAIMSTLLEKSIFKVDVLTLELRMGEETAQRLRRFVNGRSYSSELADSVAAISIAAPAVLARIRFERSIRLDQFLDGIDDDMRRAVAVGWLEPSDYERIRTSLPVWFAFLEARGILDGDVITYDIRGDSLHTTYWGVDGKKLLDQIDVGQGSRESVLGTYFAPKSSFRKGLIRSLFDGAQ